MRSSFEIIGEINVEKDDRTNSLKLDVLIGRFIVPLIITI